MTGSVYEWWSYEGRWVLWRKHPRGDIQQDVQRGGHCLRYLVKLDFQSWEKIMTAAKRNGTMTKESSTIFFFVVYHVYALVMLIKIKFMDYKITIWDYTWTIGKMTTIKRWMLSFVRNKWTISVCRTNTYIILPLTFLLPIIFLLNFLMSEFKQILWNSSFKNDSNSYYVCLHSVVDSGMLISIFPRYPCSQGHRYNSESTN